MCAQSSWPWTDGVGDGGPYAANTWDDDAEILFTTDQAASQGVIKGYLNELAVSGTSSPVSVATGAAIVKGKRYRNTAAVEVNVPTPSSATRIDRIVLEADYSGQTVRIARVAGTEGSSTPPSLTQIDGTTWQISLAQVSITTSGVITVTDEREYCHFGTVVSPDMLEQRTRSCYAMIATTPSGGTPTGAQYNSGLQGWVFEDDVQSEVGYSIMIPSDFVSGFKVRILVGQSNTDGNPNAALYYNIIASEVGGPNYNTVETGVPFYLALPKFYVVASDWLEISGTYVVAGNLITGCVRRYGAHANDTVNAPVVLYAVQIQYTANG